MSTTVDERVVEMRFDNKQFESNVATSMSTLDKLKQKLNLSGASKGLEDVNAAAKRVNMGGLANGIESVSAKFSAMQVVGVTALANITNSAVNAGKRMVAALTIDPVKTGFQEYETQINAVQTILANTSSKGTTINDVTAALDELNKYADLTIYNFTEMTRNIGTFTAAGIDLDTSVSAIQGIANLAAVSGSTSQQASTAMYQLSQALASGTVKLMDWNSVVNAGMGGEVFQNALKETSRLLGTGADAAIEASGSFRESLRNGWLTAEVLTETLKKFTASGANEYVAEYTGLSADAVQAALDSAEARYGEAEAIEKASEALAEKSGKNKDEIKSVLQMAKTATEAATKVKTFSQLWDVMKEAAQSGWAKTWQIIIGDFEEAKALLTPLADFFTNIINKMSDWRNDLLESALGKGFASLGEKINGVLKPATAAADTVEKITDALGDLDEIASKVIRGDFGNGEDRFDALTEAGKNYYRIQNKVNETLGSSFRYSEDQIEAQDKLLGKQEETTEATSETQEETVKLTDAQKDQIKTLVKLSDEELRAKGYTEEQIEAFRELRATAEKLGIPLEKFIDSLDEINGRWLLINSFKNIGQALIKVFSAIGKAWREVFDPIQADQIFNAIAAVHKFTASLIPSEETAKKLTRTFKGLFAVLDIIKTILGGGIRVAFKILSSILSYFDLNILDVTAAIGDALVAFHDWFDSIFDISGILDAIVPLIQKAANAIREWYDAFKETPAVQKLLTAIETIRSEFSKLTSGEINIGEFAASLGKGLANAIKSLPGLALQIGKDFIAGFQNGIGDSIGGVIKKIVDFCLNFVRNFAEVLGVQSPSWKAYETAEDFFQGFINGAKDAIGGVINILKKIGEQIIKVFKGLWDFLTDESGNIEWNKIFAGGLVISMIWVLKQLTSAVSGIAKGIGGIGEILENAAGTLKSFNKVLNGVAWDFKAKAILKMTIAIGILVAAIWVLTKIDDPGKLWQAVGVIVVLAGVLVGLAWAMNKFSSASVEVNKQGANIKGIQSSLLQIGLAILMVAAAVKLIADLDPDEAKQGFIGLAGIAVGMVVFLAVMTRVTKYSGNADKIGLMMKKLAVAMILMAVACKLIGMLSAEDMLKGAAFAAGFAIFVIAITKVAKSAGNNVGKVGGMVIKLTFAMILMVAFCKLVGMLSVEEMLKGAAFAAAFIIFVGALVKVTKIGKKQQLAKLGGLVLSISVSLMLMVGVCKLVSKLGIGEIIKGAAFVLGFIVLLKAMISILKIGSEEKMAKVAATILAMSLGIAILAATAILLSFIDLGGLTKGIIAVGLLSAMMTVMVKSLKGAQNVKGAIIAMAVTIAIMAGAIVALSFIDTKSLAGATAALAIVMGMFALLVKSTKGMKKLPVGSLVALTGVVVILAGIILLLASITDPTSAIAAAGSLAMLMISMSVVLKIMNTMESDTSKAIKNALSLSAMILPLALFAVILASMGEVNNAMDNVLALIVLMGAMTGLLAILSLIGKYLSAGIIAGVISLSAMVVPMWLFIQVLKEMNGIEDASEKIKSLVTMMTAMTVLLAVLTIIGLGGPAAIIGIGSLAALFVAIGGLAIAIGALMDKFPAIQNFLDTGLPVLEQLAGSIGKMIGNFIGGIGEGLSDSLVKMGDNISEFMGKLAEASDKASGVKGESFNGVKELMGVMLEIGATTVGTTIADIFTLGGTSMEKFEKDGVAFFNAMKSIGEAASNVNINEENMNAVIGVAQKLADLQSSLEPIGGVITWFTGRDDLGTFGANAASFVLSMKLAFMSLGDSELNTEAMDAIIAASTSLAELQSHLEPIGGVITWFSGRDDLGTFGSNVAAFVVSMKLAFMSLGDSELNVEAMNAIISAATKLSELQSHLEPIGGVITWFTGRDDLGAFGANVAAFVVSMKLAFMSLGDSELNVEAMNAIIAAATKLAELQSHLEPIGGVITWFTGRDDLGTFGINIYYFVCSMVTAFSALDGVDFNVEAMNSIISAATKLAELQSHLEPIGGVISWFTGRDDLGTFGTNIAAFIGSMKTALTSLDGITPNEEALTTIITAATKLSELQSKLEPMGGVVTWFTGRSDLGTFGTNIGLFADAMDKLKNGMGEDGITEATIASITNTGTALIELQKALPEEHWFDGKMNLSDFSERIDDFADAMSSFGSTAAEIDSGAVSTVITAAYRIKGLIESLVDLDTSGLQTFTGVGSGGFGADGATYKIAQAISAFGDEVADINTEAITTSVSVAQRLKTLINGLAGLDTSGIDSFKPAGIGSAIKGYADKVAGINPEVVASSITSANRLRTFISSLSNLDPSGISNFKVSSIGSSIKAYGASVSSVNVVAIASSIAAASRLKTFIASLANLNSSGVASFKTAINQLSTVNIAGIAKAFSGASPKLASAGAEMINGLIKGMQSKTPAIAAASIKTVMSAYKIIRSKESTFVNAGGNLAAKLVSGFTSKKNAVKSGMTSCLSSAVTAIRDKYNSFYNAGSYLVTGFANGISENAYKAAAKAKAMAEAAIKAAREALKINSPSKVFKAIGSGIPEGFAIGISMLSGDVKKSVTTMASTAITSTKRAMTTVLEALNSDIDVQPVIRPVVDLSDVKTGANAIHGMFNSVQNVGVHSNLNAVTSMMNAKLQNGVNDDIVSAIDKLRDQLNESGGDTYNFGNFTYDDGSNISDAVHTLVRAARMGRRV